MLIFATIFGIGFLILLFSMIFGHDSDMHIDSGDFDTDLSGPSIFSVKMFALLMVGFGAAGFGLRATTDYSMLQSTVGGVGGAVSVGSYGYFILRVFYTSQETSTISDADLIGHTAQLIDAIGEGTNGQIACIIRGREITYLARTQDRTTIAKGTQVKIISKTGNIVTVKAD